MSARALYAQIPGLVATREIDTLVSGLGWERVHCRPEKIERSHGPGNALVARVESANVTEVFTGFGERGVRAENVANDVVKEIRRYLATDVPVFEHLADQLILPMALGEGGSFRTVALTEHTHTQATLLPLFLDARVAVTEERPDVFRVDVIARSS